MSKVTIAMLNACHEWKTCTKCGEEKKRLMFYKMGKQGYRPECKQCTTAMIQARKDKKAQLVAEPTPSLFKRLIAWVLG